MTEAVRRSVSRYHQHLPAWIYETAAWQGLRQQHRATLQAVADCCDREQDDAGRLTGNLVGCLGGKRLAERAGVSARTLTNHLNVLIEAGLVVPTFVPSPRAMRMARRSLANTYGVPGRPRGLEHKRAQQHKRPYSKRADGRAVPQHLEAGDQAELFDGPNTQGPPPAQDPAHPTSAEHSRRDQAPLNTQGGPNTSEKLAPNFPTPPAELSYPPGKTCRPNHTHAYPPVYKNHGGGASQSCGRDGRAKPPSAKSRRKPRCPHVSNEQLRDMDALIALHQQCESRGVPGTGGEAGLQWIVCAAELALDEADNPAAFFAWLVNREKKLRITQAVEDRARIKLSQHLHPEPEQAHPRGDVLPEHRPMPKPRELSQDAKSAATVMCTARLKKADPFALMIMLGEKRGDPWNRERWDAALAEFQGRFDGEVAHASV